MKKDEIENKLREMISEELKQMISEATPFVDKLAGPAEKKPVIQLPQKKVVKKVVRKPVPAVQAPVPVKKEIPKSPEQQAIDAKRSRPEKPTIDSNTKARAQYQIFTTKLRMNKLDINDLANRLLSALHDYDINISKNETDLAKINSYALPAIGAIDAIKNAVESLKVEFDKLKDITSSNEA